MQDEVVTFTGRGKDQIGADIKQLAPQLQEQRRKGRPQEAAAVERQLDRLYEELRAARSRDDHPAVVPKRITQALFLDGRRNGHGRA